MPVEAISCGRHPFFANHDLSKEMRIRILALLVAALPTFVSLSAAAQEFSGNVVTTNPDKDAAVAPGRVLVADGKVRLELPDFPGGYFLVDPSADIVYLVKPTRRVFMEARQSSRLAPILVPLDPDAPCEQWQAVARITGLGNPNRAWQCTRLGTELIDGRETIRYQAVAPDASSYDVWIDPKIRFPIRVRVGVGVLTDIKNIEEKPQPGDAFELPAEYSKFDPQGLIDRIKQSDVWVEQPQSQ
jgi:hypothetical protein